MIYAVFLRGINISGKNKIPMKELKAILSKNGYTDAETLLNSGNIVLSSHKSKTELSHHIAILIKENFGLDIPVCAVSAEKLQRVMRSAPGWWHTGNKEIYDNLILTIPPFTGAEIAQQLGREMKILKSTWYPTILYFGLTILKTIENQNGGQKHGRLILQTK